jgi:hypothetical protein
VGVLGWGAYVLHVKKRGRNYVGGLGSGEHELVMSIVPRGN